MARKGGLARKKPPRKAYRNVKKKSGNKKPVTRKPNRKKNTKLTKSKKPKKTQKKQKVDREKGNDEPGKKESGTGGLLVSNPLGDIPTEIKNAVFEAVSDAPKQKKAGLSEIDEDSDNDSEGEMEEGWEDQVSRLNEEIRQLLAHNPKDESAQKPFSSGRFGAVFILPTQN